MRKTCHYTSALGGYDDGDTVTAPKPTYHNGDYAVMTAEAHREVIHWPIKLKRDVLVALLDYYRQRQP